MLQRVSFVRQHCKKISKDRVICNVCKEKFTVKDGNTSCLCKHLFRKHDIGKPRPEEPAEESDISETQSQSKQMTLRECLRKKTPLGAETKRAKEITDGIVDSVISDLQPLNDSGLINLMNILETR